MLHQNIEEMYTNPGGTFVVPSRVVAFKAHQIQALLFDWDGVFHPGTKDASGGSTFSEVDSMGINMLRFGFYLKTGKIPYTAIFTGEQNPTAQTFAQREHFDAIVIQAKDKRATFSHLAPQFNLQPENAAFFFDDILDFGLAAIAGIRVYLKRNANPALNKMVLQKRWADYITANEGGQNGLREGTEMLLSCMGLFQETLEKRMQMHPEYITYINLRNALQTSILDARNF
jgi:3-deoxy-D-manno-octulosonate 8-phosphate phosphatase (KDO 8-P phosphatase)